MGKRTMDFKVSYLDAGLATSYFSDQETALQSQRLGRKYKNQVPANANPVNHHPPTIRLESTFHSFRSIPKPFPIRCTNVR